MAGQDPILVTGAAGFIGFHVARRLLANGREVVSTDNMNAYYDVGLKDARRRELGKFPHLSFLHLDIASALGDQLTANFDGQSLAYGSKAAIAMRWRRRPACRPTRPFRRRASTRRLTARPI
jgi:nucleoside-diphosphate-sugar epimerase